MSRLEDAQKRLEDALARLESAAIRKNTMETPDMAELRTALSAAQSENETLRTTTQSVAGRLDATINRLNGILQD